MNDADVRMPDSRTISSEFGWLHKVKLSGVLEDLGHMPGMLEKEGYVIRSSLGIMLTVEGHAKHAALLTDHRESLDLERFAAIYERFLALNRPFKSACSLWQVAATDEFRRIDTLERLSEFVRRAEVVLRRAGEVVERFAGYAAELQTAYERASNGEEEFVTSPRVASLHTVWMMTHEDFLQTLGRSREEEGSW